jgi:hypothetical protein
VDAFLLDLDEIGHPASDVAPSSNRDDLTTAVVSHVDELLQAPTA